MRRGGGIRAHAAHGISGCDPRIAAFADPMRAQSAIDRFTDNSYDLVIEGEPYRKRLKPSLGAKDKGDAKQ
jgi:hypothetical protein